MAIVLMKDINKQYTDIIEDYLSKGYVVSPATCGGSFGGEHGHIDLIKLNAKKNDDIVRVWMLSDYVQVGRKYNHVDAINLAVRKYKWSGEFNNIHTLWPDGGELVSEKKFYAIRNNHCYTDDINEAAARDELNFNRYCNRHVSDGSIRTINVNKLSDRFINSMMNRLTNIKGFKRARGNCITGVRIYKDISSTKSSGKIEAYVDFDFNGKKATLHLK